MKHTSFSCIAIALLFSVSIIIAGSTAFAEPVTDIPEKERCPVCGMFVTKYKPWLTQIQMKEGQVALFDGVKDMLAYYFEPTKYGAGSSPEYVYVTDYYTQKWVDGKKAYYVTGSDILGPMGHELIPFSTLSAAESFKKDHNGKKVMSFEEISIDDVNRIRTAMKGHKMHKMQKK